MKKFILSIIILSSIFANSTLTVQAKNEGLLEETLNLDIGVEIYAINNINIDTYTFISENLKNTYNNLISIDKLFKEGIVKQYKEGNITYYELTGVIDNYASFVFYTNKMFSQIELLDLGINSSQELLDAIAKNYTFVRSYYNKIEAILELNKDKRNY